MAYAIHKPQLLQINLDGMLSKNLTILLNVMTLIAEMIMEFFYFQVGMNINIRN